MWPIIAIWGAFVIGFVAGAIWRDTWHDRRAPKIKGRVYTRDEVMIYDQDDPLWGGDDAA